MSPRSSTRLVLGLLLATLLVSGCGSGPRAEQPDAGAEAKAIVRQAGHLKKGEILIIGQKPDRYSGPYTLRAGGYVFRFEQRSPARDKRARLRVSLESRRGHSTEPYQLIVDTRQPTGQATVAVAGSFFIHVTTTSPSYVLRFTPRRQTR